MSNPQLLVLFASLASLTSSVIFGETRCPGNIETIRYHSLWNSEMGVRVMVNGSGPFEFLVDTGSLITILEPSLAAELHLTPEGHAKVVSGVRSALVDRVRLDTVEAGRYSVEQSLAAVQSLAQIQAANPRIRGLLGEDFLSHFDLLIDYSHHVLCLDPTGQMRNALQGKRIPLIMRPDSEWSSPVAQPLLIAVQLGEQPRRMLLRLDSGANVPQLYANTLDTAPWVQRQTALRGAVTGKSTEYFAIMPPQDIRIGIQVVRDLVFATPLKTVQNVDLKGEDGLLPTTLFKRVLVSCAGHFVILNPR